jgi:hypothetical protein
MTLELVKAADVSDLDLVDHPHFVFSDRGLVVSGVPDFDQCAIFATRVGRLANVYQFSVGDLVLYLEGRFGEKASQIVDRETFAGLAEESIKNYKWVAESIAPKDRRPILTFRHHQLVAALNPIAQRKWLDKAENGGEPWTTSRLSAALREGEDAPVSAVWLKVKCKDLADLESLRAELEGKGRFTAVYEQRERKPKKKEITAKAKRPGKRRRGPKK